MNKVHFGVIPPVVDILPDDPDKIYDLAMQYKRAKNKYNQTKYRYMGEPVYTLADKIDNLAGDIGAAAGVGVTMAGAKLRQYPRLYDLGTNIKQHGIDILRNKELSNRYGYGIPAVATLGTLGTAGLGTKAIYDAVNDD